MDEEDFGKILGPKKNVTGDNTQFFIQRMDTQNYEEEGISP